MLSDPNIVFLLCSLGVLAILAELANPGFEIIGLVGVVCLAVGGYGLFTLGVNWVGIILMLVSFGLFFLQARSPDQWGLILFAALFFMAGSLIMFNSPSSDSSPVSVPLVLLVSLGIAGLNSIILRFALETKDLPVSVGTETLVGKIGEVRKEIQPEGLVYIAGEEWTALAGDENELLEVGDSVIVTDVQGVRLIVKLNQEGNS